MQNPHHLDTAVGVPIEDQMILKTLHLSHPQIGKLRPRECLTLAELRHGRQHPKRILGSIEESNGGIVVMPINVQEKLIDVPVRRSSDYMRAHLLCFPVLFEELSPLFLPVFIGDFDPAFRLDPFHQQQFEPLLVGGFLVGADELADIFVGVCRSRRRRPFCRYTLASSPAMICLAWSWV